MAGVGDKAVGTTATMAEETETLGPATPTPTAAAATAALCRDRAKTTRRMCLSRR